MNNIENHNDDQVTEIHLLDHRVRLLHPTKGGFRASFDSVMLAAACPAEGEQKVLDAGCGVGGASFPLLWRCRDIHLTGVDIDPMLTSLALRNAQLNDCAARCRFVTNDIFTDDFQTIFAHSFDHVICNPPYLDRNSYTASADSARDRALGHMQGGQTVADWITICHRVLKSRGSLTIIHRADKIDQIITAMARRFGRIEIHPFFPRAGDHANRVIVRAIKDRQSPAIIHAGLIVHEGAEITRTANAILRDGQALF